jgi:hypothetical protein
VTIVAGGETVRAGPGTVVHIPRGTLHHFTNERGSPAKLLAVYAPAGFEDYFAAAGTPTSRDPTPPPVTPETLHRLRAAAPQYHLEISCG